VLAVAVKNTSSLAPVFFSQRTMVV